MCVWVYFEGGLLKGKAAYFDGAELQRQIREGATGDARAADLIAPPLFEAGNCSIVRFKPEGIFPYG